MPKQHHKAKLKAMEKTPSPSRIAWHAQAIRKRNIANRIALEYQRTLRLQCDDGDLMVLRNEWPSIVEERIARMTTRLSGYVWTFEGDQLVRVKLGATHEKL